MSSPDHTRESSVPADEIKRRIEEYRREGFKHQAMPHGVYEDPFIACPWANCDYRITAVDFKIEKHNDSGFYKQVLAAWWHGPGVAACCPGCGKYVLFGMTEKRCVTDAEKGKLTVLPDNWNEYAYIVS